MSKHDKLRGIRFGLQSTAGTPADPGLYFRATSPPPTDPPDVGYNVFLRKQYAAWANAPIPVDATDPPGDPSDAALVQYLQDDLARRAAPMFDAMTQYPTGVYIAPAHGPLTPISDPAWQPVPADPWAPKEPVRYRTSPLGKERKASFPGPVGRACPRCGLAFMSGDQAMHVAPPGLPRTTVHLWCVEVGDQVQPRPELEETP